MAFRVALAVFFVCSNFWAAQSKIYDRCELARELRDVHEIPEEQLATWLCIANYESNFNTSAHNPGSGDHGLFQISELYWCSPPGDGYACGLPCSALKDEDIEDDVICARRIYRQHQRISGDGFTAWVVYKLYCRDPSHVTSFIQGCFDEENLVKYGYQPIYQYEAMNLPTMRIPMPITPSPQPPTTLPPISSRFTSPPLSSVYISPFPTSQPPTSTSTTRRIPPTKTTFAKTSTAAVKFQERTTMRSSSKAAATFAGVKATTAKPRVTVSTYKPLLNLSSMVTSSRLMPPQSSKFSIFTSSPKFDEVSTYKPFSSTFSAFSASTKLSVPQRPSKISTYKIPSSLFTTIPTSFKFTTPKPPISTYKPFLNRFSSTFRTNPKVPQQPIKVSSTGPIVTSSVESTTVKPTSTFFTYKPFLNQFSKTSKLPISAVSPSISITPKPPLIDNDNIFTKAAAVKPRETETPLPFTLKSGVKPFHFKRDEKVYAFVNKSGYAFAISSHGFKLFRTGE